MAGSLLAWVPRIGHLADEAREVHVVMNNCYQDYAVRGARDIASLLSSENHDLVVQAT